MSVWVEVRAVAQMSAMVDLQGDCWWCGGPTNTLDFGFEAWLHLGWCTTSAWRSFFDASAERGGDVETGFPF